MKKLLIFHSTIAPYRIDFFNDLYNAFESVICLRYRNLRSQKFDYDKIYSQFKFKPVYLKEIFKIGRRSFNVGYWKYLNRFKPDIVLTEEFSLATVLVFIHRLFSRRKYKIVTICDDSYNMVAEDNDFSKLHKFARRVLASKLDDVILVEPKVVEWYRQRYGVGYYFPIIKPEATARANYARLLPMSLDLIHKFNLTNIFRFLFVGRLVKLKNVDTIINAFSELDQSKNILIIVGTGPEETGLKELAKGLNVMFTGRLEGDQLNVWYNIADCFVLASYQEAFGAVTNEALLAGCRCLVSNKAGSSCLIRPGVNGDTFNPYDIAELSLKMLKEAENPNGYNGKLKDCLMLEHYHDLMTGLINHLNQLV